MSLCQYKNIFGAPNTGVHKYRIFNMAIIDVIFTFLGAYSISYLFKIKFWKALVSLILLGIILHKMFCVRTTIDKLLFYEK